MGVSGPDWSRTRGAALEAAKTGEHDAMLRILAGWKPNASASLDDLWLAAELAYQHRNYPEAVRLFRQFERDPRARATPPWQRFMSSHRRAFALFQLGRYEQVEDVLREVDRRIDQAPELEVRRPDLTAMRGHLLEIEGDLSNARATFAEAYRTALASQYWRRAESTASDAGRISAMLGEAEAGLEWLDRAEEALKHQPNARQQRTLELRRGMLYAMRREYGTALRYLDKAIRDSDEATTEESSDARSRRADVYRALGRVADAERDLREGVRLCRARGMPRHEAYLHRDLALLYQARRNAGDAKRAESEFKEAVTCALSIQPQAVQLLFQLGEVLLEHPEFLPPLFPAAKRRSLARAVDRVRELQLGKAYEIAERRGLLSRYVRQLQGILRVFTGKVIELATCSVDLGSGRVFAGSGQARLRPSEIRLLQYLLDHPRAQSQVIMNALGTSREATRKLLTRLRKVIGESLSGAREGNQRYYSLRLRRG